MITFGMVLCDVCSPALSALLVIPGVLAICWKLGAAEFRGVPRSFATRWHSEHCARTILRPARESKVCACASARTPPRYVNATNPTSNLIAMALLLARTDSEQTASATLSSTGAPCDRSGPSGNEEPREGVPVKSRHLPFAFHIADTIVPCSRMRAIKISFRTLDQFRLDAAIGSIANTSGACAETVARISALNQPIAASASERISGWTPTGAFGSLR